RASPPATCAANHGPLSRVSIPISTSVGPWLTGDIDCCWAHVPRATPNAWAVLSSIGGWPATHRMPSVPKGCLDKSFYRRGLTCTYVICGSRTRKCTAVFCANAVHESNPLQGLEAIMING